MSFSPQALGLIVALGVAMAGALLVLLFVLSARSQQTAKLSRRVLHQFADNSDTLASRSALMQSLIAAGTRLERWLDPKGETAQQLLQAGWRGEERRTLFYALRAAALLIALLGFLLFTAAHRLSPALVPLYAFAALALGILIPNWLLRWSASQRRAALAAEVPLFVHILVLLFEAGLSTRQAIASLVREGRSVLPLLGVEMEGVLRQLDAGGDIPSVLTNLAEVLAVNDLTGVLTVLRGVDRYGGEIREPLLEALAVLEQRNALDLREKVNLVSGRMTVVMVLFFFPALLIFVAGPAVISILKAFATAVPK